MCKSPLHPFLQALPKVELHLHIEGTLEPSLLFQLAAKNNIKLPDMPCYASEESLQKIYNEYKNLDDFLEYYKLATSVLVTADDFRLLAMQYFTRVSPATASSGRVHHAEIFFDPQSHLSRNVSMDTIIEGFKKARNEALQSLSVTSRLIMCFLRDFSMESAHETLNAAEKYITSGDIHGIGLCGSEKEYPPEKFTEIYDACRKLTGDNINFLYTAHAGEESSSEFVTGSLDHLRVTRIDHGIASANDEKLMERLSKQKILLTVCPVSNWKLKCVPSVKDVPLDKLRRNGVRFCINSDDPAYFDGKYVGDVFCIVQESFDEWGVEDWIGMTYDAIEGCLLDVEAKNRLKSKVDKVRAEFKELDVSDPEDDSD